MKRGNLLIVEVESLPLFLLVTDPAAKSAYYSAGNERDFAIGNIS